MQSGQNWVVAIAHRVSSRILTTSLIAGSLMVSASLPLAAQTEASSSSEPSPRAPEATPRDLYSTLRPQLRLGSEGAYVVELQALLKLLGYYAGRVNGLYQEDTASAVSAFQQAAGLEPDGVVGPATWNRLLPTVPLATSIPNPNATPPAQPTAVSPQPDRSVSDLVTAPASAAQPESTASTPPSSSSAAASTASETANGGTATTSTSNSNTSANQTASSRQSAETATAATPVTLPILRLGMHGPAVIQLQERLQTLGVYQGAIDGIFGPATQTAVKSAQQQNQLTPDGVVGPATWRVLFRANQ